MSDILIDKEFCDLLPPLTAAEYGLLEESVRKEGCREPIRVWNGVIVDGHKRYEICGKHNISYEIKEMEFDDRDHAMLWMIKNHLGRRNLSDIDKVTLADKAIAFMREQARKRQSDGGRYKGLMKEADPTMVSDSIAESADDQPINIRKAKAEISGVSEGTVYKIDKLKEKAPDLLEQAHLGKMSVDKAYRTWKAISRPHEPHRSEAELYTPPEIIEAARKVMGSIDTDPASDAYAQEWIQAGAYYTTGDDGLAGEWSGNVWLNPPRATELVSRFTEKLISELSAGHIRSAIVLVDNATDAAWFHTLAERASALCLHKGRIRFVGSGNKRSGSPETGQVFLYFGPDAETFRRVFGITGLVLQPMAAIG